MPSAESGASNEAICRLIPFVYARTSFFRSQPFRNPVMSGESSCAPGGFANPAPRFSDSLAEARGGVCNAAGPLLEAYRPYLLAIANSELPDGLNGKMGASDVVQDTLVKGL